jgi:uncharacterized membrane protein
MSTRTTLIIVAILIVASTLAGLLLWNQLPDPIASHWGVDDQVNGYMSKFWGVFLMPVITLVMLLMFLVIPSIDPLKANIATFRDYFNTFIALIVAFMSYIYGLTLVWNLGYTNFRMSTAMLPAMGLLFIFVGVMVGKAKRNYFIGIRTPWTLSSDKVWNETHRIGGKLFIASGVLALLGAFFPDYAFWFIMVPVLGSTLFTVAYSYVLFQREPKA